MRNALLAPLLLAATLLSTTGCPCGAYNGAGDQVYARASDSLILCANGGFVANLATGTLEGHYKENPPGSTAAGVAVRGDNGQVAFDFIHNPDGTATTPQLGAAAWQPKTMDQTALDHADVQCTDLETRAWWSTTP